MSKAPQLLIEQSPTSNIDTPNIDEANILDVGGVIKDIARGFYASRQLSSQLQMHLKERNAEASVATAEMLSALIPLTAPFENRDHNGRNELMNFKVKLEDLKDLKPWLEGLDVNAFDALGESLLTKFAKFSEDTKMVEFLLENNADPSFLDFEGNSILLGYIKKAGELRAKINKEEDQLHDKLGYELILQSPEEKIQGGKLAQIVKKYMVHLYVVSNNLTYSYKMNDCAYSEELNNLELIDIKHKIASNQKLSDEETDLVLKAIYAKSPYIEFKPKMAELYQSSVAIEVANYEKFLQVIELLIKHKASIHGLNFNGNTLFHELVEQNLISDDIVEILVKNNIDIDGLDANNITPLTRAILNNDTRATDILIENGANPDFIIDNNGNTPRILAETQLIDEHENYLETKQEVQTKLECLLTMKKRIANHQMKARICYNMPDNIAANEVIIFYNEKEKKYYCKSMYQDPILLKDIINKDLLQKLMNRAKLSEGGLSYSFHELRHFFVSAHSLKTLPIYDRKLDYECTVDGREIIPTEVLPQELADKTMYVFYNEDKIYLVIKGKPHHEIEIEKNKKILQKFRTEPLQIDDIVNLWKYASDVDLAPKEEQTPPLAKAISDYNAKAVAVLILEGADPDFTPDYDYSGGRVILYSANCKLEEMIKSWQNKIKEAGIMYNKCLAIKQLLPSQNELEYIEVPENNIDHEQLVKQAKEMKDAGEHVKALLKSGYITSASKRIIDEQALKERTKNGMVGCQIM